MLPMFDPVFLIIERDPDKLHAYARGLLHQLRNPSRSYSFEMIKAATVWLVGAYVEARVPLAPEMSGLIAGVVKWNRRASAFRKVQEKNERPPHGPSPNRHRARRTASASLPAISSLGGFRTPAPSRAVRSPVRHRPASENLHKGRHHADCLHGNVREATGHP
jgi:hypothetical protein